MSERYKVRSLLFPQGKPAEISAGFDRAVSRVEDFVWFGVQFDWTPDWV
jgi:hypothetical protein